MSKTPTTRRVARHAFGAAASLLGSSVVLGSVVLLNQFSEAPKKKKVTEGTAIQVQQAPKPKPKQKVKKPKPKPRSTPKAPPPPSLAALSSGIGNFAIDLPGFDMADVGGSAGDLLGGDSEVTHTSDTVDDPPKPTYQGDLSYPAKLRQQGVEGYVVVGALVTPSGSVDRVSVVESSPPGAFDQYALDFVRGWRFQPAQYKGEAVQIWVEQKVTFKLGT